MRRLVSLALLGALTLGLTFGPPTRVPVALADDDDDEQSESLNESPPEESNQALLAGTVAGQIYHVGTVENKPAVVIIDQASGLEVVVLGRNPNVANQITNGTACIGRFITAEGDRTTNQTLNADGMQVDTSKRCS